jgi:hypothetical protein
MVPASATTTSPSTATSMPNSTDQCQPEPRQRTEQAERADCGTPPAGHTVALWSGSVADVLDCEGGAVRGFWFSARSRGRQVAEVAGGDRSGNPRRPDSGRGGSDASEVLGLAELVELAYGEVDSRCAAAVGWVSSGVRSGELFAALSLATDLGTGQPAEHGLRTCLSATELATLAGLEGEELEDAFYLGLLHSIGCTADAPVTARAFGDNVAHKAAFTLIDPGRSVEIVTYLWRNVYPTAPRPQRLKAFMAATPCSSQSASALCRSPKHLQA